MLILRRRPGESVLIGDHIEVEIIEVSPKRVKLGIRAPDDVLILRKEIRLAGEQNQAAVWRGSAEAVRSLLSRFLEDRDPAGFKNPPSSPIRPL